MEEDWIHQVEEEDQILEEKEEKDWIWDRDKVQQGKRVEAPNAAHFKETFLAPHTNLPQPM